MIVEKNKIDTDNFLIIFNKKFKNFCTRVPLFVSYNVTPTDVTLYRYVGSKSVKEKLFTFPFDFNRDVKENIFEIKKILMENYYPTMVQENLIEIIKDPEELNQLISEGTIKVDDVTSKGGIIEKELVHWRIEKIVMLNDEVFVRNLNSNNMKRFRLKIPCTHFIKEIQNMSPEKRWNYFSEKARFISEAYEVDRDNNIINN